MAWLVERKEVISAINKVRGLGFGDAKLVYDEISKVMYYQYLRDEDIKMVKEVHNLGDDFRKHLDFLKHDGIIHFENPISSTYDEELEAQLEIQRFHSKYKEAISWMATLGEKEKELIKVLIEANICRAN